MVFFRKRVKEPLPPNVVKISDLINRRAKQQKKRDWNLETKKGGFDFLFFILLIMLLSVGIVMITSASGYVSYNEFDNSQYYLIRQLVMVGIGLVAFCFLLFFRLRWVHFVAWWVYILGIFLSLYVLFFGHSVNGSQRWINFGWFSFQPSEFMKIALALVLAFEINRLRDRIAYFSTFCWLMGIIIVPVIITFFSNLSTALIMTGIGFVMLIIGGVPWKKIIVTIGLLAFLLVVFFVVPTLPFFENLPSGIQSIFNRLSYRLDRVRVWLDPFNPDYMSNESYQIVQSLYAIVRGGWFGVGYGAGTQKLGNIPEAHNDIIFAVICEEFGFVGAFVVILLFFLLILEGMKIASNAPNTFCKLMTTGLMTEIALQVVINVAVTANLIPATGIALPFISYGGSAVIMMMGAMGLVLNVSRHAHSSDLKKNDPTFSSAGREDREQGRSVNRPETELEDE